MSGLAGRAFLKMNGIGNEIIVLDLRGANASVTPAEARAIARGEGLAYDQLMVLSDPRTAGTAAFMTIFNNDGSLSGACGNGTRCVAWALTHAGGDERVALETQAGLLDCQRVGPQRFTVDMGAPGLGWREIPLAGEVDDTSSVELPEAGALGPFCAVNMGNPHAVFFVSDAMAVDLPRIGPALEHNAMFPERANISVAQVAEASDARVRILLRVWERGAGVTQACGSAACATLVAAVRTGRTGRAADIDLPGGTLFIEWRESDSHVLMTGDVALEFEGRFAASLFEDVSA
ncbi:MAG: diaminopimelate epimerase [Beijerinckiaceae bacterium]|nr:diaminopimelate epimerase [Beijerinckiaceae bacterium]